MHEGKLALEPRQAPHGAETPPTARTLPSKIPREPLSPLPRPQPLKPPCPHPWRAAAPALVRLHPSRRLHRPRLRAAGMRRRTSSMPSRPRRRREKCRPTRVWPRAGLRGHRRPRKRLRRPTPSKPECRSVALCLRHRGHLERRDARRRSGGARRHRALGHGAPARSLSCDLDSSPNATS